MLLLLSTILFEAGRISIFYEMSRIVRDSDDESEAELAEGPMENGPQIDELSRKTDKTRNNGGEHIDGSLAGGGTSSSGVC